MDNQYLKYSIDNEGIATILIDQINQSANLFSVDFIDAYYKAAIEAINNSAVKGVIVTSAKNTFMAGGDLRMLSKPVEDAKLFFETILAIHHKLRAIEKSEKPFIAAINGTALGGGMELCLTCNYRIAINSPKIKLGFPEAKLGLLPGGGGTSKTPYLLGLQKALLYTLQGKEVRPQQALKDGLIDEVAENKADLLSKAKQWIFKNPKVIQPWDNKKHKIPGGGIWTPNGAQVVMGANGNVSKLTHGNYPSQKFIMSVVYDGIQLPIDRALEVEARYFTKAVQSPEAKNMIRTGFMGLQAAKKGKARPSEEPKYEVKKLGILGAGMMGAGIAYVSAKAGIDVILKDVTIEGAEKGKLYSEKILDKTIAKGYSTKEKKDKLLSQITTSDNPKDVEGCDLVIEAVFESPELKDKVTKETEKVLATDKIYGTNTSTIPISLLAKSLARPENFIGIHFFSPVDKMPLVEIIVGEKTGKKAIAAAVDYTVAIGKYPIVVNDSRGFFTSRCFGTYVSEALFLLEDGVPAIMIENIAKKKGMAIGPLAVHDEVSLTLSMHVFESDPTTKKANHQIRFYNLVKDLVENDKRTGKKEGAGFYDYPNVGKKKIWKGLNKKFESKVDALSEEIIAKRLLHRQALESYRCLDEGVLNSAIDGDIGSVLGWGFPIYTGGALSYIDFIGINSFINDCDAFKRQFGERFNIPDSLRNLAAEGKAVHQIVNT